MNPGWLNPVAELVSAIDCDSPLLWRVRTTELLFEELIPAEASEKLPFGDDPMASFSRSRL